MTSPWGVAICWRSSGPCSCTPRHATPRREECEKRNGVFPFSSGLGSRGKRKDPNPYAIGFPGHGKALRERCPVMSWRNTLKWINWTSLVVLTFGSVVVVFGFIFGIHVNRTVIGLAVVLGWVALIIVGLVFVVMTFSWFIGKAPWYWRSLVPLNFSFVLWAIALFRYNTNMGMLLPAVIVASSFAVAWLVVSNSIHERKPFLLVIVPSLFSGLGYFVPIFLGSLLMFVSVLARRKQ